MAFVNPLVGEPDRMMEKRLMVQEGDYLAVFNSAHRVMKAESLLKSRGYSILLIPAPRQLMTDCGLALRISPELRDEVIRVLEQEQLQPAFVNRFIGGIYCNEEELRGDI
jgi:Protein of unknown function (DUF3343)